MFYSWALPLLSFLAIMLKKKPCRRARLFAAMPDNTCRPSWAMHVGHRKSGRLAQLSVSAFQAAFDGNGAFRFPALTALLTPAGLRSLLRLLAASCSVIGTAWFCNRQANAHSALIAKVSTFMFCTVWVKLREVRYHVTGSGCRFNGASRVGAHVRFRFNICFDRPLQSVRRWTALVCHYTVHLGRRLDYRTVALDFLSGTFGVCGPWRLSS